jgi:Ca-activated chloride channel family protein
VIELDNIDFKYPINILFGLLIVATIIILFMGIKKKENILGYFDLKSHRGYLGVKIGLIVISLGLILIALLGPQKLTGFEEVEKKGLDIYVLIDTSKSMLVEDVAPNRIGKTQKVIEELIDELDGDRIGFIPFASDAYIQMPLTDDYEMAKMFLNVIDTDMMGGGGSDIDAAVSFAIDAFKQSEAANKIIIVLSDGENPDLSNSESLSQIEDQDMKVFTIGIGTEKGGLIPVYNEENTEVSSYKQDEDGNYVNSKLDASKLKALAAIGNGKYYHATLSGEEIDAFLTDISSLDRTTSRVEKIKEYQQLYQYFLGAGLLLLMIAMAIPERKVQR